MTDWFLKALRDHPKEVIELTEELLNSQPSMENLGNSEMGKLKRNLKRNHRALKRRQIRQLKKAGLSYEQIAREIAKARAKL